MNRLTYHSKVLFRTWESLPLVSVPWMKEQGWNGILKTQMFGSKSTWLKTLYSLLGYKIQEWDQFWTEIESLPPVEEGFCFQQFHDDVTKFGKLIFENKSSPKAKSVYSLEELSDILAEINAQATKCSREQSNLRPSLLNFSTWRIKIKRTS